MWALSNEVPNDTISEAMWEIGSKYPVFPWFLGIVKGVLVGHFWWPLNEAARKARK